MKKILGISAYYHDSAAALISDGEIIAACHEERFSRIKHDSSFPKNSINFLLNSNSLTLKDIDYVVFYEKPILKFNRLIETYISNAPKGFKSFKKAIPVWIKEKLFQKKTIIECLREFDSNFDEKKLLFTDHHLSHAASAFYPSPFEKAVILTLDGVGEWTTTSIRIGTKNRIELMEEIYYPHSIGLLYSAFTYFLGFKVNSGEYKVMGLAPYGEPIFKDLILQNLIDLKDDGSFRLNQKYFDYSTGLTMVNDKFFELFGEKRRLPEKNLEKFHMNVAASIQAVTEEVIIKITRHLYKKYKIDNLCLAGGVALNCVANGKILKDNYFKNIWVQPAAGDAGGALGSALSVWYEYLNNPRNISDNIKDDKMKGSYLGSWFKSSEVEKNLQEFGLKYHKMERNKLINFVAEKLANKKAIGWFQGKAEFGPRALGSRSILADPRCENMQKNLNLKIKFRESFRPFAPAVLADKASEWFDLDQESPYMQIVSNIKENKRKNIINKSENLSMAEMLKVIRSDVPAITHVDFSARIQTVTKTNNKIFHDLLEAFYNLTNCPILINTSFNVRGEPIVDSPTDAIKCFLGTNLDYLVIEEFILDKEEQDNIFNLNYLNQYELD